MDRSRVSDFSIERILSPQLGLKPRPEASPEGHLQGFGPDPLRAPVPVPGCLQYRGLSFGEACCAFGAAFSVYPNSGLYVHFAESAGAQPSRCSAGPTRAGGPTCSPNTCPGPDAPARQKARMRTVFTDGQTRQLEALFERSDYPAAEARAEVARRTGVSEETVRVWFKNRRARRKRQGKPSSPPPHPHPHHPLSADNKLFTSLL